MHLSQSSMDLSPTMESVVGLVSRVLIAILFIQFGLAKITGFEGTVKYISGANVPLPELGAVIAIIVEVGLASLLLIGFKTRWVALAMFVYVVVLPFIFHQYWSVPPARVTMEKLMFFKDLAIAGGLLAIAHCGPGDWSVDGMQRG